MDYSFFCKQLGTIPEEVRVAALELVYRIQLQESTSTFRSNPGYTTANEGNELKSLVDLLIQYSNIPEYLKTAPILGYDLARLEAYGSLREHTDNTPPVGGGFMTQRLHKVHFLLSGVNCVASHRRDKRVEPTHTDMEAGKVMVFNNYVYHGIVNKGATERVSLVVKMSDTDWQLKGQIYETLSITDFSL